MKLTKKQQEHVLRDFMQWSGGHLPHEVPWTKREAGEGNPAVNTYLRLGAPADLPRAGLRAFLLERHRDLPPTNNMKKKLGKLEQARLRVLRAIGTGAFPESVRVVGEPYSDDHILCCNVEVCMGDSTFEPGTNPGKVKMSLLWCGWEVVAACEYFNDSPKARVAFMEHVQGMMSEYKPLPDSDPGQYEMDKELVDLFKGFRS